MCIWSPRRRQLFALRIGWSRRPSNDRLPQSPSHLHIDEPRRRLKQTQRKRTLPRAFGTAPSTGFSPAMMFEPAQVVRKCAGPANQIGRPREAAELLLRAAELIGGKLRAELICDAIQLADTSRESDVALRGFQAARQYGVRIEFEGAGLVKIAAEQFQWQEREDTKERLGAWLRGDKTVKHRLRAACCALIFADHYVDQAFAAEVFETLCEVESIATGSLRLPFLECLLIYHSSFGSLGQIERDRRTARRVGTRYGSGSWRRGSKTWPPLGSGDSETLQKRCRRSNFRSPTRKERGSPGFNLQARCRAHRSILHSWRSRHGRGVASAGRTSGSRSDCARGIGGLRERTDRGRVNSTR